MEPWLSTVCRAAIARMNAHAALVDPANTDEATFRSFFLAALRKRLPRAQCQTEWFRYDLLVQHRGRNVLIEFKFYLSRPQRTLDGAIRNWKGGAGPKNESEFWNCVRKLRGCQHQPMHGKYLVLVYERQCPRERVPTFHGSYGDLAASTDVLAVWRTRNSKDGYFQSVVLSIK